MEEIQIATLQENPVCRFTLKRHAAARTKAATAAESHKRKEIIAKRIRRRGIIKRKKSNQLCQKSNKMKVTD